MLPRGRALTVRAMRAANLSYPCLWYHIPKICFLRLAYIFSVIRINAVMILPNPCKSRDNSVLFTKNGAQGNPWKTLWRNHDVVHMQKIFYRRASDALAWLSSMPQAEPLKVAWWCGRRTWRNSFWRITFVKNQIWEQYGVGCLQHRSSSNRWNFT